MTLVPHLALLPLGCSLGFTTDTSDGVPGSQGDSAADTDTDTDTDTDADADSDTDTDTDSDTDADTDTDADSDTDADTEVVFGKNNKTPTATWEIQCIVRFLIVCNDASARTPQSDGL